MEYIKNIIAGALIGIANTIPGVSGGTMAVILDMYDKLLNAFSLKNLKNNLGFLTLLGIGGILGILGFSKVIVRLLEEYPLILNYIFIGLIIGSIPIILKNAKNSSKTVKVYNMVYGVITLSIMIWLSFSSSSDITNKSLEDMGGMSILLGLYLFAVSFVSAIAMLLPGISGSLLLLIFGVYAVILESIDGFYFPVLIPVALGVGLGVLAGIKAIRELLNRFPQPIYFAILGLMVGSIFTIWPGFEVSTQGFIAIGLGIFFGLIAYFFSRNK